MKHRRRPTRALRVSLLAALGAAGCQDDPPATDCRDPRPILDPDGDPTGVERCADGSMRRVALVECVPSAPGQQCGGEGGDCDDDSDCTAQRHGRCIIADDPFIQGCVCRYGCATDADCGDGEVCLCPGVIDGGSHCAPASCTTGADCASGACLINSTTDSCNDYPELACLDPGRDECRTHADCGGNGHPGGPNCIRSDDLWTCQQTPICGRPLTLAGAARTAPTTARADWSTPAHPLEMHAARGGIAPLRAALLAAIA